MWTRRYIVSSCLIGMCALGVTLGAQSAHALASAGGAGIFPADTGSVEPDTAVLAVIHPIVATPEAKTAIPSVLGPSPHRGRLGPELPRLPGGIGLAVTIRSGLKSFYARRALDHVMPGLSDASRQYRVGLSVRF